MRSLILLGLINLNFTAQFINLYKQCACSDQYFEADCRGSCLWEKNQCRNKICADYSEAECQARSSTCRWDTSCNDYTPVCSDFKTEANCDYLNSKYNCAWKGAVCADFTKCSDYFPGTTGCSSKSSSTQRCRSNIRNTACENYIPAIITCTSFKTAGSCCYSSTGSCIWDTTCKVLIGCAQIISQATCSQWSRYCTYANTCRDKICADNHTADTCTYVNGFHSSIGTLCKWDTETSKCTDATDTSALTATTCGRNTQYTFTWDGTKCNECTGYSGSSSFNMIREIISSSIALGIMSCLVIILF